MTWILFDESDRRKPAPYFDLPGIMGGRVGLGDTRGQENLVIFFAHTPSAEKSAAHNSLTEESRDSAPVFGCSACRAALENLASQLYRIRETGTQLLVILPATVRRDDAAAFLASLPFPVVVDPGGETRRAYSALMDRSFTAQDEIMLFLLDEFGAAYVAYVDRELEMRAVFPDTLKWLEYIALQCPE